MEMVLSYLESTTTIINQSGHQVLLQEEIWSHQLLFLVTMINKNKVHLQKQHSDVNLCVTPSLSVQIRHHFKKINSKTTTEKFTHIYIIDQATNRSISLSTSCQVGTKAGKLSFLSNQENDTCRNNKRMMIKCWLEWKPNLDKLFL